MGLSDGGDQHTAASEILHVEDSKTSLSKHSDDSQTRYQPAAPFSPFTVNKTQNLTFKIEACIRFLACWLRWGLTMRPRLASNPSSACHSLGTLGLQKFATTACHASLQQQTVNPPHSFLFSFPSPTHPLPCLNLKLKHQTTAPYASHSAALACLLSDHSRGDQAEVTVSVGGETPQYDICPATLHNPLIGPGPCGAGAQAAEAHLFSFKLLVSSTEMNSWGEGATKSDASEQFSCGQGSGSLFVF